MKKWILLTASAVSALTFAPYAQAQSPTSSADQSGPARARESSGNTLDEIVVIARKVAENQQDVPVAITAFSGQQLQEQSALRVADIQRLTPGLYIREAQSTNTAATFSMRGQVQTDVLATLDPSVGVYVDGLYWARAYGINSDLLDVASVQSLKGPQGTLFGRNTTGGAILIQSNDPDPSGFSGLVSGTYGRFDERSGTAVLNAPLVQDKLAVRLAGTFLKRDGYVRETNSGVKLGQRDSWAIRGKILAHPTETTTLLLSAELFKQDALTAPFRTRFVSSDAASNVQAGFTLSGPGAPATRAGEGIAFYNAYIPVTQNNDVVTLNLLPRSYAKTQTYSGTFTVDTFFGAIKAIAGYRKVHAFSPIDLDGSNIPILRTNGFQTLKQYSGELQATGKAFGDSVDFASGLFYFHESGDDGNEAYALPSLNPNNPNIFVGIIDNDSMGVYGQATWHPTEALGITAGLRYSADDKGIETRNKTFNAAAGAYLCSLAGAVAPVCSLRRRDSFEGLSYTLGADYRVNPDVLIYAKTSKGFRSGGQNLRAAGATSSAFVPFNPETAYSHEAGFKGEFFDRRARLNIAAYYSTVKDIQRTTIVVSPSGQSATIVGNAGKLRVYGFEAEASAILFEGFRVSATSAYTKPKYINYVDPTSGADRRGERIEGVPKWTYSISGSYKYDLGFGMLGLNADYNWQSDTPLQSYNNPADPDNGGVRAATTLKSVGLLSARASLSVMDDQLELAVFGRNLTNNREPTIALYLPAPLDIVATQNREPRTFGVSATYRFGQ
ncbi:MAG: TonB-dependent receptor [Sphingobium sp.]